MNTTPQPRRPLVDTSAAAEILGVSPRTVRRLAAERRIPAVHVGRAVRFEVDDLAAFVDANKIPATTAF
ncbi:helix-turn-helix domain-containing protein [Sanguibacter sp. HDW7]|uniref:helix-turn-helix domain-containing protein n=1 Tax=Sanguibacter sp. HDW7 TaxID=2714931 RepID=UPI00140E57FA|nr:helix-turn-helix domain-containing protein [Sanguibacter sp. HDW7]QIK83173.1 helix-turn-helix domain-containing protein [Sanguibacter sp. HDW7]